MDYATSPSMRRATENPCPDLKQASLQNTFFPKPSAFYTRTAAVLAPPLSTAENRKSLSQPLTQHCGPTADSLTEEGRRVRKSANNTPLHKASRRLRERKTLTNTSTPHIQALNSRLYPREGLKLKQKTPALKLSPTRHLPTGEQPQRNAHTQTSINVASGMLRSSSVTSNYNLRTPKTARPDKTPGAPARLRVTTATAMRSA
jgi:hypothetical protein